MERLKYATITLYRHKKTGTYLVQPMARHPTGAVADFGEPTRLGEEEFESRIVEAVRENLANYDREPFRRDLAPRFSNTEYARFTRAHDHVSVARKESGLVEITPSERVRGGYQGINEAVISFPESELPTRLIDALREAFRHTC